MAKNGCISTEESRMKCQRCGAELLDTDTFCVKCGQKVTEPAICPKCGEHLREGTRFCHKCGALVDEQIPPEDDEIPVMPQKTIDIPFDVIEKSIIMEAEQAVVKRDFSETDTLQQRAEPVQEEVYDGEDGTDVEEEDVEEAYRGLDFTRLTMLLGIVLLLVLLVVGGVILKNKLAYEFDEGDDSFTEQQEGETADSQGAQEEIAGKLQIIKNVNIRTQPDTENSKILGVAESGEVYEYYGLVNEAWYHIRLDDGQDAYVYKEYVSVL